MEFLFTNDPRRTPRLKGMDLSQTVPTAPAGTLTPPIIAPMPEQPWVFYSNNAMTLSSTPDLDFTDDDDPEDALLRERVASLIEAKPRYVLLDHPRLDVIGPGKRTSIEYHEYAENMVFAPLRKGLGPDAVIVQYGIRSHKWNHVCPSVNPTFTCYNPADIGDMAAGRFPAPLTDEQRKAGLTGPENWYGVWLPGPGQWTNSGTWSANDYQRAVEAARIRGLNVLTWFDGRAYDHPVTGERRLRFTEQHWHSVCRVVGYHKQWPMLPAISAAFEDPRVNENFRELLKVLSGVEGGFDMGELLEVLAKWK